MSTISRAHDALRDGWGRAGHLRALGAGLINDTFLAQDTGSGGAWVLQRINDRVFTDPGLIMDNVGRVVRHVAQRAPGLVPDLVSTLTDRNFHVDELGGYWRLWQYVDNAQTLQSLDGVARARSAGGIFAELQNALADLPGPRLQDPIEGFMRLQHYLDALGHAVDRADRPGARALAALADIQARGDLAGEFQELGGYVHGDCKVNNVLFRGEEACSVVDLDTVMFGHWAWDFGDLVRSGASVAGRFSLSLFGALASGFAARTHHPVDTGTLSLAPRYVGVMLAARFLADHLSGDVYFRVQRAGENLDRAVRQTALVKQMEACEAQMRTVARVG